MIRRTPTTVDLYVGVFVAVGVFVVGASALALTRTPHAPEWVGLALLALGLLSTTVAYVFFYRLIADVGPVKAITVTLLVPVFGM